MKSQNYHSSPVAVILRLKFGPAVLLLPLAIFFFTGCGQKQEAQANASQFPPGIVESTIQAHWRGQDVKVGKLAYDSPVPSKGERVPTGVKLYPIKVQLTVGMEPEKEVLFYFYQTPFGSWEAYTQ